MRVNAKAYVTEHFGSRALRVSRKGTRHASRNPDDQRQQRGLCAGFIRGSLPHADDGKNTPNIRRLEISPEPTRDGICFLVSQDLLDIKFGTQSSQDFDFHTNLNPHSRVNFLIELPSVAKFIASYEETAKRVDGAVPSRCIPTAYLPTV